MIDFTLRTLPFLWDGMLITLYVSGMVVLVSLALGLAIGVGFIYGPLWLRVLLRIYSDVLRGTPLLVLIFSVYYLLPFIGLNLQPLPAAVAALAAFKAAHVGEIARGAISSISLGQTDAGKAIGLTFHQRLAWVIFPQAVRRFLPPWINSVTDTVKGSALVSLVGIVDLMLAAQQVIGRTYEPMPVYLLAASMYFVINYTLSLASRRLEAKFSYIRE